MPPPNVSPQTPVEPTTPPGVTRPKVCAARSKSSQVEPPRARATSSVGVDIDGPHMREVDHEPAVDDAMAGWVVPAPAHGDLQVVRSREVEGDCNVGGPTHRAMTAGRRSTSALKETRAAS